MHVQCDGIEYEFDVVGDLEDHNQLITKTRCPGLLNAVIERPSVQMPGQMLKICLTDATVPRITEAQSRELWQLARARGPSVGGLIDLANRTLNAQYTNPREITVEEFPRVVEALKQPALTDTGAELAAS